MRKKTKKKKRNNKKIKKKSAPNGWFFFAVLGLMGWAPTPYGQVAFSGRIGAVRNNRELRMGCPNKRRETVVRRSRDAEQACPRRRSQLRAPSPRFSACLCLGAIGFAGVVRSTVPQYFSDTAHAQAWPARTNGSEPLGASVGGIHISVLRKKKKDPVPGAAQQSIRAQRTTPPPPTPPPSTCWEQVCPKTKKKTLSLDGPARAARYVFCCLAG